MRSPWLLILFVCACSPSPIMVGTDVPDMSADVDMPTPTPDLAVSTIPCVNNAQCMTLPHGTGACGALMMCAVATCDPGFADCDKLPGNGCEADTQSDAANCGGCGTSCTTVLNGSGACMIGKCVIASCNTGFANCDGLFATGCPTATSSDIKNCGACGHQCSAANGTANCTNGMCGIASCTTGYADCDMNAMNGCEAQIANDPMNCGGCMKACMTPPNSAPACADSVCSAGMCTFGFSDCDKNPANGCEVIVATDINNCGTCGMKCPMVIANGTPGCKAGVCGIAACKSLYGDCNMNSADGCEKSLAADVSNCGSCGMVCNFANAMGACLNGQCGIVSCNMGFTDCDKNGANGCEVNTQTDAKNCGTCGNVCPMNTPQCQSGTCKAGPVCKAWSLGGIGVPQGTTATADRIDGANTPDKAIDGDMTTRWGSGTYTGSLTLQFPAPVAMTGVRVAADASPSTNETYTITADGNPTPIGTTTLPVPSAAPNQTVALSPISVTAGAYSKITIAVNGQRSWVAIGEVSLLTADCP